MDRFIIIVFPEGTEKSEITSLCRAVIKNKLLGQEEKLSSIICYEVLGVSRVTK